MPTMSLLRSDEERVAYILTGIACLVIVFLPMVPFIQRRNIQPIKARFPLLAAGQMTLNGIYMSQYFLNALVPQAPCLLIYITQLFLAWGGLSVLAIRVFIVYGLLRLADEAVIYSDSEASNVANLWFLRHRYLFVNSYLCLMCCGVLCMCATPEIIVMISDIDSFLGQWGDGECIAAFDRAVEVAVLALVFLMIYFAVMAVKLRKGTENYYLKAELSYLAWNIVLYVFFIILENVPAIAHYENTANVRVVEIARNLASTLLYSSITFVFPLYKSYYDIVPERLLTGEESYVIDQKSHGPGNDLDRILDVLFAEDAFYNTFKAFAMKELSVENVVFVKALIDLRSIPAHSETYNKRIDIIFHRFCKENAALQVNISYDMRTALETKQKTGKLELADFADAEKEIRSLLRENTVSRFLHTDSFTALWEERKRLQARQAVGLE